MKRFLLVLLTASSLLACTSCAGSSVLENLSESGAYQDTNSEKCIEDIYSGQKKDAAEAWEMCDKSEMQTFITNNSGEIALTMSTDKREYVVGEPIRVKAEVQNITDSELWYVCGNSIENYPVEIHVEILGDGRFFKSDRSEISDSVMVYFSMKPGEVYDDYVTFETGYYNGEPAEPGVYNGTCYITTVPDEDSYEHTMHSVDFSITLTGDEIVDNVYPEPEESDAEIWEMCDKSEMQTFTNEGDGVVITVSTDKREYTVGEPIMIKAMVQNDTDREMCRTHDIGFAVFTTELSRDGRNLYNKQFDHKAVGVAMDAIIYVPILPGETYDDYVTFETGYYNGEPAEPGVYNGTCYIYTVPEDWSDDKRTKHSVNFSIEIKPQAD